jgi:Domain of unknown function (DUF4158)
LCYLRYPGRVLGPDELPDAQLVGLVAAQLGVSLDVWDIYAQRDQTRREHLQEILERLGLKQFDRTTHREIAKWLLPTALQTTQGLVLAEALQRVCAEVATCAQRQIHKVLSEWLTNEQRIKLDQLLAVRGAVLIV